MLLPVALFHCALLAFLLFSVPVPLFSFKTNLSVLTGCAESGAVLIGAQIAATIIISISTSLASSFNTRKPFVQPGTTVCSLPPLSYYCLFTFCCLFYRTPSLVTQSALPVSAFRRRVFAYSYLVLTCVYTRTDGSNGGGGSGTHLSLSPSFLAHPLIGIRFPLSPSPSLAFGADFLLATRYRARPIFGTVPRRGCPLPLTATATVVAAAVAVAVS